MHARILWMSLAMEAGYTDMIYGLKAGQKSSKQGEEESVREGEGGLQARGAKAEAFCQ